MRASAEGEAPDVDPTSAAAADVVAATAGLLSRSMSRAKASMRICCRSRNSASLAASAGSRLL